jgi:Bifunctional DNA primase/polymerase, N-terminal
MATTSRALMVACGYIRRGWAPVPIPHRQKGPVIPGWQTLRLTEQTAPQYFNGGPHNIGVVLGDASDHLVDVDLDCLEALALAPAMLPPTVRFGRASAPCSHWLYRAEFPANSKAAIPFDDPIVLRTDAKAARLVELRIGGEKGAQTVFPGSVHESGEAIAWEDDGARTPPAQINAALLARQVGRIAAAALLARYWPPKGNRHDLSLALGGALARAGWDTASIEAFVAPIVQTAHDPRPADRVRCARDAAEAVADGQPAYGFPKLKEIFGGAIAGKLADWLGITSGAAAYAGPAIRCGTELTSAAEAAEQAIAGAGLPLFRRDTLLVRPVILAARGANDQPIQTVGLAQVNAIMMRSLMEQAARFEKYDSRAKAWIPCKPPTDIAELVLARAGHWPFPEVRGVLAAPSLRPDGSLLDKAGYDLDTGMYLLDPPAMPDIPEQPTERDGRRALAVLAKLLDSFPWQGDDDSRAVGVSALVSPVVRAALPTVPLHAISSPEAGTGKSYLTQLAAAIATGFPCPVIASGSDDEETEKRLSAVLLTGQVILSVDNISRPFGGDFLCQVLDQPLVKIRILGQTAGPLIEPRMVLFATGNNLTLLGDIVRRAVIAHMDAGLENPWQRQFAVDPLAKVQADRGTYIAAALTLCRAFLVSGEQPLPPLASFTAWSNIVRSAIVAFGGGDPVKTMATAIANDPDREGLATVLITWSRAIGEDELTVAEVIARANKRTPYGEYVDKDLRDALMTVAIGKSGDINPQRLGLWLRSHRDRMLGRYVLRRCGDIHTRVARWSVACR